jgi:hypothetical protein
MLVMLFAVAAAAAVRGLWSPCGLSMLSALNPVSERARGHRYWATAGWYLAGATTGGALLGAGCAAGAVAFGRLHASGTVVWTLALAGAVIATVSDARPGGWSLPIHPRQVDERWLTAYRRWIYAGGYGVQVGSGFATYIMTAGVHLTALLAVLTGSPMPALLAGVAFGVIRGLGVLLAAPARDPERLPALLARIDSWAAGSATAAATSCGAVAVVAAWRLGGLGTALAVACALAGASVVSIRGAVVRRRSAGELRWTFGRPAATPDMR